MNLVWPWPEDEGSEDLANIKISIAHNFLRAPPLFFWGGGQGEGIDKFCVSRLSTKCLPSNGVSLLTVIAVGSHLAH